MYTFSINIMFMNIEYAALIHHIIILIKISQLFNSTTPFLMMMHFTEVPLIYLPSHFPALPHWSPDQSIGQSYFLCANMYYINILFSNVLCLDKCFLIESIIIIIIIMLAYNIIPNNMKTYLYNI